MPEMLLKRKFEKVTPKYMGYLKNAMKGGLGLEPGFSRGLSF